MKHVLTAALILAAAPALATCPTRADLREGIVLVQNEPFFVRTDVELRPAGFYEVRLSRRPDQGSAVTVRTYLNALAAEMENVAGSTRWYTYTPSAAALDGLDEAGDLIFTMNEAGADGKRSSAQVLYNHIETAAAAILDCSYETWLVREMRATAAGTVTTRELVYTPDLGVILSERHVDPVRGPQTQFNYTWIGTSADVAR